MQELQDLRVVFGDAGVVVYVTYTHDGEVSSPGSKGRTRSAATLARKGLEAALECLDTSCDASLVWGGFASGLTASTDTNVIDRKESAA